MLIKTSATETPRGRAPVRGSNRTPREGSEADSSSNESTEAQERTANYQGPETADASIDLGAYQGLLGVAEPPQRVQKLANWLHWDRNLPADVGESAALADCLRGVGAEQRLGVIGAYWRARERAARYQALSDQVEQLNSLNSIALRLHDRPEMADANVRLNAARRAARAAVFDAHVLLLAADFELTLSAGRRLDDPWLLPSTAPQSGRYLAPATATTRGPSHGPHWSEMVRLQHEKLEERADAVIHADAHRAALVNEARHGATANATSDAAAEEPMHLDGALTAVLRQNQQTLTFLHDLTGYNMAIARYALVTFPASISNDELVKKLVVARSTRRES